LAERSVAVLPYPGKRDEPPRLPFQLLVGVDARDVVRAVLVVLLVVVLVLRHRAASVTTRRARIAASASEARGLPVDRGPRCVGRHDGDGPDALLEIGAPEPVSEGAI